MHEGCEFHLFPVLEIPDGTSQYFYCIGKGFHSLAFPPLY